MKIKRKKRAISLIEIMIVILLIGLIGGALAFNMRGSIDKGKVFKSEQNAARVYDILMMAAAMGEFDVNNFKMEDVQRVVDRSPLVKDGAKLLKDGWGIDITIQTNGQDELEVFSAKARAWQNRHS